MLLMNRTLLKLSKGLWGWMAAIAGLKMVTLIGAAAFAKTISGFLGNIASPSLTVKDAGAAILSALAAAFLMLCSELLRGEAEYRCTARARTGLRARIFSKVLELDAGNIEKIGPVSAITSSVDGVESMQTYYSQYLPGLIYCMCAPVYLFFQLKGASLTVAILLFAIAFILLPLNNVFRSRIELLKTEYWTSLEDLTGYYLESVRGLATLKLFERDEDRTAVLTGKADAFNRKIMDVMKVNFLSFLMTDGMIYGAVLAATGIICINLVRGNVSFSAALMVLLLSYSFFDSVRQLMGATHTALAGVSAAEKVSDLLDMDTSRPYCPDFPKDETGYMGIRMEHVSHTYTGRNIALKDVSLTIRRGKVTALAGLSGCGKSTVAGLLMRFFDPAGGRIVLEGRDYISFTPEELRKHIIMVPQSVSMFAGTIADNLRIAKEDASEEELLEALKQVRLKDWVLEQPDGLLTDVGDGGGRLSGGQRQKIGIARALLCQAEYIIFDEATSALDNESERVVQESLEKLAKNRTTFVIAHRLTTIQNAQKILVLTEDGIAESGSHEELLARGGVYEKLYHMHY